MGSILNGTTRSRRDSNHHNRSTYWSGCPDGTREQNMSKWLKESDDPAAMVTGQYFYHRQRHRGHPAAPVKPLHCVGPSFG